MRGCQNYGPFLGTLNIRGRIIIGIQKGTIILTTTHMRVLNILKYIGVELIEVLRVGRRLEEEYTGSILGLDKDNGRWKLLYIWECFESAFGITLGTL